MSSIRDQLAAAAARHEQVRIRRRPRRIDDLDGFVVAAPAEWTLIARLGDVWIDGYAAVPTASIRTVINRGGAESFTARALDLAGEWPPGPPARPIDLTGIAPLIESAAAAYPLITIHLERDDPDVCFVGEPVRTGRKRLRLREVDADAVWNTEVNRWPLKRITRVDFGGRYEQALHAVAGPVASDDEVAGGSR